MKKFTIFTALVCFCCLGFAQTADEENIKKLIDAQTEAIKTTNMEAWKAIWQQDPKTSTTFISRNGYNMRRGWDSIKASIERNFQTPLPAGTQVKSENYNIRTGGNMASVDFDMIITPATDQSSIFPYEGANRLHNHEVLVKENGLQRIPVGMETMCLTN